MASIHAESLTNPLSDKHAFCWEVKSNFEMDFPNEESLLSYDTDLLDEDDKFHPTAEVENIQSHTDSNTLQVNTSSSESSDYRNRIKISEFDPGKKSVTSWVDNNVYSLELYGTRDESKLVARLLNG